jgi:membrane-associated protease RseP (regulator of RpoE activity)
MLRWFTSFLVLVPLLTLPARGDEPKKTPKQDAKAVDVPYRLTDTQHVMVRIKINGKGPFNFIVDTGAPLMFVAVPIGKKIGLDADKGWATLDKLEIEGGLVQEKVKVRVETPFQLEGMNGMGLAGAELHGIMGYTILAKYRMEFDFTRDKMKWTPLAFDPPQPQPIGAKGPAGLELIGGLMKFLGALSGLKPAPPPVPRGFLGIELEQRDEAVAIKKVMADSPAAEAGLKAQDVIAEVQGKAVKTLADAARLSAVVLPGQSINLTILRGEEKQTLKLKAGDGL